MAPYKDKEHNPVRDYWKPASLRLRRSKRTFVIWIAFFLIIYLIYDSIPWSSILELAESDLDTQSGDRRAPNNDGQSSTPDAVKSDPDYDTKNYAGPIKYMNLLPTLSRVYSFRSIQSRHVLFAASSMQSASTLAILACDMAKHKKNTVHIILMGRDEGTIEFFEKANGIGGKDCLVTVHDGRPNSAATSSEHRMELSVMSALKHTHSYMSPVVIMVDSVNEDPWFTRGVSARAKTLNIPLISLPKNAATAIPWMTKLDSGSLAAWHKPTIDIVIQADKHSGSLIRLLKSLAKADYFNMNIPRLHIELEADVDVNVRRFISNYKWPGSNEPIIRHRILEKSSNSQQQAVDFVQSFFPATWDNFILILDPNAEVSPFFYHWFMYSILEYRYSSTSFHDTTTYAGVALHRPLDNLMGASFKKVEGPNSDHPFLYNAPSTQATVIFGEHWRQFHAYLSNRFLPKYADHVNYTLPVTLSNQAKQASWLSYFLELSTARGWLMLYPQFDSGQSLVILPQQRSIPSTDEELSLMTLQNTMLSQLPNGALPQWEMMHMFDVFGTKSDYSQLNAIRDDYLDQIASCRRTWKEPPGLSQVEDLFCRKDEWITASSTTTTEASVATPST